MTRHDLLAPLAGGMLLLSVVATAWPPREQEALIGAVAQLLALEDSREYDGVALARASQHTDTLVRSRAAMALGRIGDPAGVQLLVRLLADRDTGVRAEAAFALGRLGDRRAAGELVAILESFPAGVSGAWQEEVVAALARLGGAEADAALAGLLERRGPETVVPGERAVAVALLEAWRLGDSSRVATRLASWIRQGRDEWRRNAVYSAARMRLASAGAVLLEAATDADPQTRAWVAAGLIAPLADRSGAGRDAYVAALRRLLDDRSGAVRINALRALGSFEDSTLAPLAAARLADRDPNVAVQAAQTLGQLRGSRAATALAERFQAPGTWALRRAILLALAPLNGSRALALAAPWKTDADWRTQAAWGEVVAAARPEGTRDSIVVLLSSADPRTQALALGLLGQLAREVDAWLLEAARTRLAHPDHMVRATATGILGRTRDPALVGDLVAAYRAAERDEMNDARLAAVSALGSIAAAGPAARSRVEEQFFSSVSRSRDYLVRRAVRDRLGLEAFTRHWRSVGPIETGRTAEEYRGLVRRYVLRTEPAPSRVTLESDRGSLVVTLFGSQAPLTVDNFVRLAERRYFDGGRWHRVVPNFVVQDGDPRGDGTGGPGTVIRDEINRRRYDRGTVGMALSGPDTGGSQFFICHSPQPHLDGGYTSFGQVTSGWAVLDLITQGDRIRRVVVQR